MLRTLRPFFISLILAWLGLIVTAWIFAQQRGHSYWIMTALLPAFLVECVFYLAAGFPETRGLLTRMGPRHTQAAFLLASALIPYLIFGLLSRTFQPRLFGILTGVCAVAAFWHAIFPRRLAFDAGFLVVVAAPVILKTFARIYLSPNQPPDPPLRGIDILGHLMWIRLAIMALLVLREWDPGPFSFWPAWPEWKTGVLCFLLAIVPVAAVAIGLHFLKFSPKPGPWWLVAGQAVGLFFGALWVIALSEDLFFRGVVQRGLAGVGAPPGLAIAASALLYGSSHLWTGQFPNWRDVAVTAVLGVFLGVAYWKTGSVRAPMVTHALFVVAGRMLFAS